jgi:hypothetical protein
MAEKRARVDWDAIEPHYRANVRSLRDIGAEFGVSDAAIIKHAAKSGWERDLGAKIKAKADAKLAAALVATERADQPAAKLTEAVRVEVEAEVQARVRQSHRTDINRSKRISNRLLEALEKIEIAEAPSDTLKAARKEASELPPMVTLKEATGIFKQLVDAQRSLVTMEREAYGIAHLQEDPDDQGVVVDPLEGAKRLAFILARAGQQLAQQGK